MGLISSGGDEVNDHGEPSPVQGGCSTPVSRDAAAPGASPPGAHDAVTLVIPGRNAARVLRVCLDAVVPLLRRGELAEIIFVDDASTDETAAIVAQYPITCLKGQGNGPGAARNLGWRAARTPLVWFIDSDCVADPDALSLLRPHLRDERIAAVGGSYGNMRPDSLLACLIHEEIVERHRRMEPDVNFLATFNVLYRRSVLEELGGFDERFRLAQDAELAYRVQERGYRLRFELGSRVGHFHPTRLRAYMKTQARQGYYRVMLYRRHPAKMAGDHYSGLVDYIQPPLALIMVTGLAVAPLAITAAGRPAAGPWPSLLLSLPASAAVLLLLTTLPLALRMVMRTHRLRYSWFVPMSFARSIARGLGMLCCLGRLARPAPLALDGRAGLGSAQ
jgi:cellulose synthase/poly-beta-1,6-N-acetylglucosamine synthase-like glycosyltransferase